MVKKSKSKGNKLSSKKVKKEVPRIISLIGQHEKKLEKELANFVGHIVQLKKEQIRNQKKAEKMKMGKDVAKSPSKLQSPLPSSVKPNQAKSSKVKSNSDKASSGTAFRSSTFKKKADHLKLVSKDPSTTNKK